MQASAGVHDQDVLALRDGAVPGPGRYLHRVAIRALLIHLGTGLATHFDQLLDGRRPVYVAGRHGH